MTANDPRADRDGPGSAAYWEERYAAGGHSGDGSRGRLARFKADVLNAFVRDHDVGSVVEFGCGDGGQLALADYPAYVGFDVSPTAIQLCRERFAGDSTKTFHLLEEWAGQTAALALSLDVIYHLVEDAVYERYMETLFDAAARFVIAYSTNVCETTSAAHIKHRRFTDWVHLHRPAWRLVEHIPNAYPYLGDNRTGSRSEFFVFEKPVAAESRD